MKVKLFDFSFLILGEHSTLIVSFHLQRHMGNFVIQVYGPCVLLVVISWVSFWLNREATSDRISLGKYKSISYNIFTFGWKHSSISIDRILDKDNQLSITS